MILLWYLIVIGVYNHFMPSSIKENRLNQVFFIGPLDEFVIGLSIIGFWNKWKNEIILLILGIIFLAYTYLVGVETGITIILASLISGYISLMIARMLKS